MTNELKKERKTTLNDVRILFEILSENNEIISLLNLTERQAQILKLCWNEHKTFEEISQIAELSKERVRQVYGKTMLKMKYEIRNIFYKILFSRNIKTENEKLIIENRFLMEKLNIVESREEFIEKTKNMPLSIPIKDLDISVRLYNCMVRCKFNFLGDVIKMNQKELMKIRNFGKRTLMELEELLNSHGLHLF